MTASEIVDCVEVNALATLHAGGFAVPWPPEDFERLLGSPGVFALAARGGGRNAGFILIRVVADEAEVLSLVVDGGFRRQGLGRRLLCAGASRSESAGAAKLFLEVGEDNAAALMLYRNMGFRKVGRRPGYYPGPRGDGLTMRADLPLKDLGNGHKLD